jgi:hypothetical protein
MRHKPLVAFMVKNDAGFANVPELVVKEVREVVLSFDENAAVRPEATDLPISTATWTWYPRPSCFPRCFR